MATVRKRTYPGTDKVSWLCDYRDATGRRRFETFTRKKDAQARLNDIERELKLGVHTPNTNSITLAEAAKLWLNAKALKNQRATMQNYQGYVDHHIVPLLGRYKLAKLTVPVIAAFRDKLLQHGTSATTTRKVLVALKGILKKATVDGLVAQNNAADITVEEKTRRKKLVVGTDIPDVEEVNALIANVEVNTTHTKTGRWRRPFLITAVFTGLRSSEMRGLRWSDVDLDKKVLHVRQRADRFNDIGMTKSDAGERRVPLPPMVVTTLKDWKDRCPKSQLGLVFPTSLGTPLMHSNICNLWFYPLQKKLGMVKNTGQHKYKLHALRHFYGSWLINYRDDKGRTFLPKQIQDWMGHSSITMTYDTYGHLMQKDDDQDLLAAAEQRLTGSNVVSIAS